MTMTVSVVLKIHRLAPEKQEIRRSLTSESPNLRETKTGASIMRAASAPRPRRISTSIGLDAPGSLLGTAVQTLSPETHSASAAPSVARFMSGTAASDGKSKRNVKKPI
jgi:hypothetical protein